MQINSLKDPDQRVCKIFTIIKVGIYADKSVYNMVRSLFNYDHMLKELT